MIELSWFLCLIFLKGVLSNDPLGNFETVELQNVTFLPFQGKYSLQFKELADKLVHANRKEQVAILNEYADEVLANANSFILNRALEPIELPGFEASFRWTIFTGWVYLDNGLLRGVSTFTRKGDVVIKYEYPNIRVTLPLGFSRLTFGYIYEVKFMDLGPVGTADGKSDGNKFTVDLSMNMVTLRAKLERFRLNTLGSVSLTFSGNILLDWMLNLILIVVMPILKPIIGTVLGAFVTDAFEYVLEAYNQVICKILADCPEYFVKEVYQQVLL